ncbi:hypothetical protein A3D03_06235 [Candidatus Gottesmanbacteria bacterium RIFCSPHIGHO2_02_FULL_40_13]|uniref:Glycosyltransferase 2-like domain-containing protein n=1 Tax=Candidatus Gottesmanbacteria bacterium RIFCSPHIGHO2_02_FULL_40_13 TaxID=1798384 RepID=A0A1F6A5I7_9BACT|nr:MAG: hypothetical protein A3D03_06235 [Candidatus Gottesmanbacteria bacterium RIFCSPHIGHO2_02_FULL_40_13]
MTTAFIIPARNEEQVIGKMLRFILAIYDKYINQIIVVDDGSSDKTAEIIEKIYKSDKRVFLIKKKSPHGVGLAIREGLKYVSPDCEYVFLLDADFIRNIPDLEDFFIKIKDYDGLIGSRYLEKNSLVHYPTLKKIFNRLFHLCVRVFLGINRSDLTNNFKFYRRKIFNSITLTARDYAVNAETGLYPILKGFKIGEIPVTWYARSRNMGSSKFKMLQVTPGYLKVLLHASLMSKSPGSGFLRAFQKLIK